MTDNRKTRELREQKEKLGEGLDALTELQQRHPDDPLYSDAFDGVFDAQVSVVERIRRRLLNHGKDTGNGRGVESK